MPGEFKLDHLQLFEPILFQKVFNFFIFILGGQFLLPQRANNGASGILPTSKWNDTGDFACLGHSYWTICIPLNPFCSENFPSFSLSYWEANSYYPRGPIMGKGNSSNPQVDGTEGFQCPGHSNRTICSALSPFCPKRFSTFSLSYWEANSYYPRGQ